MRWVPTEVVPFIVTATSRSSNGGVPYSNPYSRVTLSYIKSDWVNSMLLVLFNITEFLLSIFISFDLPLLSLSLFTILLKCECGSLFHCAAANGSLLPVFFFVLEILSE